MLGLTTLELRIYVELHSGVYRYSSSVAKTLDIPHDDAFCKAFDTLKDKKYVTYVDRGWRLNESR